MTSVLQAKTLKEYLKWPRGRSACQNWEDRNGSENQGPRTPQLKSQSKKENYKMRQHVTVSQTKTKRRKGIDIISNLSPNYIGSAFKAFNETPKFWAWET